MKRRYSKSIRDQRKLAEVFIYLVAIAVLASFIGIALYCVATGGSNPFLDLMGLIAAIVSGAWIIRNA